MTRANLGRVPTPEERATLPVWPDTGQLMGLSKAATYDAVARGDIPSIRIGRRLLVPTAALRRMLALDGPVDAGSRVA